MPEQKYKAMRDKMVTEQIEARGVLQEEVLKAMRKVPRHEFVATRLHKQAYSDYPLPIGEGQTISQPYIVALMTELLKLKGGEKILEIGTGSGYQAAVLAEIADKVYTIEIVDSLAKEAGNVLKRLGYENVNVKSGDGYQGWKEHAPYDGIIITAAPPKIPKPLTDQLKVGGKMVLPLGVASQDLIVIEKTQKGLEKRSIIPVRFVPMTGEVLKEN